MYLSVLGASLFFAVVGSQLAIDGERMRERPTLLVLHGGPGFDHVTMRPYFDRFADTHQVVYLDHRGNGRSRGGSGSGPETWRLAQWGDDVRAFCDQLGITKPVVFGQSFGGMVAMAYASRHPGHAAKVVLSSTAARLRLDVTYAMLERFGGREARALAERFWTDPTEANAGPYLTTCLPLYNPKPSLELAQAAKRSIMRLDVTYEFIRGEQRSMDLRPDLAKVTSPVLVLGGELDPITPVACAEEIAGALPAGLANLEVFAEAGHGVHRDAPEKGEASLRRFLAS